MPKPGTANTLIGGVSTTPLIKKTKAPFSFADAPVPSSFNVATKQNNPIDFGAIQMVGQPQQQPAQRTPLAQAPQQTNAVQQAPQPQVAQSNPAVAANGTPNNMQMQPQQPTFGGLVGQLSNFQSPVATDAAQQANQSYGLTTGLIAQLRQSRDNEAQALGKQGLAPIPMGDITGRQAVIRQQYETQQANLAAQAQAASNLYSPALTAGTTGQQQRLTGMQSAAQLGQPQAYGITETPFDPISGQYGTMPGGSGGAFRAGQVQGDQTLGQQYASNVSATNQARAIKTNIQQYLAQNPTLNPSLFADVNSTLQFLSGKVSSPEYQTLANYLQEYINTLAPILGVGGDPTNLKTQIANGFVNAAASGQSISQVLDGIEQLAEAKLNAQKGGSFSNTYDGASGTRGTATGTVIQTKAGPVQTGW